VKEFPMDKSNVAIVAAVVAILMPLGQGLVWGGGVEAKSTADHANLVDIAADLRAMRAEQRQLLDRTARIEGKLEMMGPLRAPPSHASLSAAFAPVAIARAEPPRR
jgi:hypothetical protein